MIGNTLAFIGNLGLDVYILEDEKSIVRPGGFAYYSASALYVVSGDAFIVANITPSFDKNYLTKFKNTEIEIILNELYDNENLFIFDFRNNNSSNPTGVHFSNGNFKNKISEIINQLPFKKLHIHLGTSKPDFLLSQFLEIKSLHKSKLFSYSTNVYLPYLEKAEYYIDILEYIKYCDVVFMNYQEFSIFRERGNLSNISEDKLLVITLGKFGAVVYCDGIYLNSYAPQTETVVSAVGAGDTFTSVFLNELINSKRICVALIKACDVAAQSVKEYGAVNLNRLSYKNGINEFEVLASKDKFAIPAPIEEFSETHFLKAYKEIKHATALFIVYEKQLLLIKKQKGKAFEEGLYYVPGGKLEQNETPIACAVRELKEETNLDVKTIDLLEVTQYRSPNDPDNLYIFYQFIITPTSNIAIPDDDVASCEWVNINSIKKEMLFDATWAQIYLGKVMGYLLG